MPQVSAAVLRSKPSSTSASASIRRAAALFSSPPAALRSSEAVRSSRVIDTAVPIDAAPLKREHRVRVSLIWESLTSHSLGPLVLLRALPGDEFVLSPSPVDRWFVAPGRAMTRTSSGLGTSNGCQDHTASPSAHPPLPRGFAGPSGSHGRRANG